MTINDFFIKLDSKLSNKQKFEIKTKLEDKAEQCFGFEYFSKLKDPSIGILIGLFGGFIGLDRFYMGDKKMGIIKLVIFLIGCFTILSGMGLFILFFFAMFVAIDLYFVYTGIQKNNFKQISSILFN